MNKGFRKSMSKLLVMTVVATTISVGNSAFAKAATNVPKIPEVTPVPEKGDNTIKEVAKDKKNDATKDSKNDAAKEDEKLDKATLEKVKQLLAEKNEENKVDAKGKDPYEMVRVIVEVSGQTASDMAGNDKASVEDIKIVKNSMNDVQSQAMNLGGKIRNVYGNVFKGFSVTIQRGQIEALKAINGVIAAREAVIYSYPKMSTAKDLTDVYKAWSNYGYKGQGTVVSIIDTGVDYSHKDMRLSDASSKTKLNEEKVREIVDSGVLRAGKSYKNKKDIKGYYTEKVPFGFNYADDNDEVIDKQKGGSMHGMHVAGIVAANGIQEDVDKNDSIQGVAPEAQLLAMKVFSNGLSKGASSDDIIAAIEDSITLGVDVINMSLGSPAGYSDSDDPENKVIQKAVDKGVIVVVASGNEGYSTAPYRDGNINDIGTSGSPGMAKESFTVANYANSSITLPTVSVLDENGIPVKDAEGKEIRSIYIEEDISFKKKSVLKDIVDVGLGTKDEFAKSDVKGKVVLIKRSTGVLEKILNAVDAGASGIIMYNHEMGGETIYTFPDDPKLAKVKGIFIGNKAGTKLASMLKEGKTPQVKIASGYGTMPSPYANDFSSSSGWGCGPDLSFKPQISAPGLFIHSTFNNNEHGLMSGTSMAAPHIAGAMAVVKETIENKLPSLSGKELVDFAKASMMNTARVQYEKPKVPGNNTERPFSPRRQGAGMLQLNNAIRNRVIATHGGQGVVELKEIKGNKAVFNIELTNYGKDEAVYELGLEADSVFTNYRSKESDPSYQPFDIALDDSQANVTFDNNKVTVAPGGKKTVKVTLNIGSSLNTEQFLEGFIKFTSKDSEVNPDLSIPFMGFYGDWAKERILNDWSFEEDSTVLSKESASFKNLMLTEVLDKDGKSTKPIILGEIKENKLANAVISPNKDSMADSAIPYLYFLRNAKYATVELFKDGKNLGQVAYKENIRKQIVQQDGGQAPEIMNGLAWDGTYYDAKSGKYVVAKDGDYELHYKFCVDLPESAPQEHVIPIKVDTKAPVLEVTSDRESKDKEYTLTWKASDEGSAINGNMILVNGQASKAKIENKDGVFSATVTLKENSSNEIALVCYDSGYNMASTKIRVVQGAVESNVKFDNLKMSGLQITEADFKDGVYLVTGKVTKDLKSLEINGEEVKINEAGKFEYAIKMDNLTQGTNYLRIKAINVDGSLATIENGYGETAVKIYFDSEAPILNITSPAIKEDVINTVDGKITLKGDVADSAFGYTFCINGKVVKKMSTRDTFGLDVTRYEFNETINVEDGDKILLEVIDWYDHTTTRTLTVKYVVAPKFEITGVEDGKSYKKATPKIKVGKGLDVTATLNEKPYKIGTAISKEGEYSLKVIVADKDGVASEQEINFIIDKTKPVIKINGLKFGRIYESGIVPSIEVNEEAEIEATLNGKKYEIGTPIKGAGIYRLSVKAKDEAGNTGSQSVMFIVKKGANNTTNNDTSNIEELSLSVDGISKEIETYDAAVTPVFKTNSKAKITLELNGKSFANGATISENGDYTLNVKAMDEQGNIVEDEYTFVIEKKDKSEEKGKTEVKVEESNKTEDKDKTKVGDKADNKITEETKVQ